eukprot:GFUD01025387.1.p1 GENE.GFUD01025387.1~~GFUD01025387.1.p1  ORF type:complete len:665 (+),score=258.42 GFUD01025387.1:184-1995(+)
MFDSRAQFPDWEKRVADHFSKELSMPDNVSTIPSLNLAPNHSLTDGQLVRFRCMVQDMFDPEFYLAQYQVKNMKDGTVRTLCGRYRDVVSCGPGEELVTDGGQCETRDRLALYCVSPPGEAAWVVDQYRRLGGSVAGTSGTRTNNLKRSLEGEAGEMEVENEAVVETVPGFAAEQNKKLKAGDVDAPGQAPGGDRQQPGLNLPLPGTTGRASIIKLYDVKDGEIKLNDLIEVVGIVSLDPTMAATEGEDEMGHAPSLPPPSLVPRLHVLSYTHLHHNNPLLPSLSPLPPLQQVARVELLTILTTCMLGDRLAAEYLLLHLISKVYLRKDVLVLGKLSLNLHNMTSHEEWPRRLATLLSLLTTNSHYLPLTRATLDTSSFTPKKDFEANRLVSGTLQLAPSTHLWLDETVMTDGQLTAPGLKNLTALGNLITWQKLEYDFQFQAMEYETDIPCLVMSEGRSMLPSDVQIMVKPSHVEARPDLISKTFGEVGASLTVELLDRARQYITICRMQEYNLTEQVMKAVQDDFVTMRQAEQGITVEDFHALLVVGRLVSLSNGRTSLDPLDWEEAKRMEKERKERVASLPARSGANMANGMPLHLNAAQ